MRKLIMKMSMSLDGFAGSMDGANDWVFKTGDEESLAWSVGAIREAGLILMGRKTFEKIGPYWQTATGPFAPLMNEIPKALFSKAGFSGSNSGDGRMAAKDMQESSTLILKKELMNSKKSRGNRLLPLAVRDLCRALLQRISSMNIIWLSILSRWVRGCPSSALLRCRLI